DPARDEAGVDEPAAGRPCAARNTAGPKLPRGWVEIYPAVLWEVHLDPAVGVVLAHGIDRSLGLAWVQDVAHRHPRGDANRAQHDGHRRRLVIEVTPLGREQEVVRHI